MKEYNAGKHNTKNKSMQNVRVEKGVVTVAAATSQGTISAASADPGGAFAVQSETGMMKAPSTIQVAKSIVEKEGIPGLWRGNVARCMKVCDMQCSKVDFASRK